MKTACARELRSFIAVAALCLFASPAASAAKISAVLVTYV